MRRVRVIPTLLVDQGKLVKTIRFKNPRYIGDPLNTIRILNEKEVDEVVLLDIGRKRADRGPDLKFIRELAGECFMPLAYGGGISSLKQIELLVAIGVEKVILNTSLKVCPGLIREAADHFGSQSIVVSIDIKRDFFGSYRAYVDSGKSPLGVGPAVAAAEAERLGAGEIIVCNIDRDGTRKGYDLRLVREVATAVAVPVIALGGANNLEDLFLGISEGLASAVAAGSMFSFRGARNAVLVSYPDERMLVDELFSKLN